MEQMLDENRAVLTGKILSEPEFSHKTYGESFFVVMMGIARKSGYEDCIPLMISERLLQKSVMKEGDIITVNGQVRTYNRQSEGRNHLMIVVFVKEFCPSGCSAEMENYILLEGYTCKETVRRTSPMGRELCDLMLAVNRMYNKSDYIPCIAWGRNAVYAGTLGIGEKLIIEGRLQSRKYRKYNESGEPVEKTAYEVSITHMQESE